MIYEAKDILFLVGAGISKSEPSNIPLGSELTRFVLEKSCGIDECTCIFDTWNKFSGVIKEYNEKLKFPIPRLETVLGCINELDTLNNRRSILYGLKSLSNVPFNHNHLILSHFLKKGSNILTTNFDLGIQNAYKGTFNDNLTHIPYKTFSCYYSNNSGKIYHLHGSSKDDVSLLGATVEQVKKGFNKDEKTIINELIKKSKLIVILGYSVSDSFDITPYFESLPFSMGTCCFIQHKNEHSDVEFPNNIDAFLKKANIAKKIANDTTEFLKRFEAAILKKNLFYKMNNNVFDWKKEFDRAWKYSYSDNEKLLNLLGIRYNIGFNTKIISEIRPSIYDEIKLFSKTNDMTEHRINDYVSEALRNFDELKEEKLIKPLEIVDEKNVNYIDKSYLFKLKNECMYYILKYKDVFITINDTDKKRMEKLVLLLEKYKNYSYSEVQYISYISASCKYLSLLKARLNIGYSPSETLKELMISLDITYIEGSIAALTHYAEHCIILQKLNDHSLYYNEIQNSLQCAYNLSELSGYYYHCKIIMNLIEFYELDITIKKGI